MALYQIKKDGYLIGNYDLLWDEEGMLCSKDVWLMQVNVIYWYTSREEAQAGREKKTYI